MPRPSLTARQCRGYFRVTASETLSSKTRAAISAKAPSSSRVNVGEVAAFQSASLNLGWPCKVFFRAAKAPSGVVFRVASRWRISWFTSCSSTSPVSLATGAVSGSGSSSPRAMCPSATPKQSKSFRRNVGERSSTSEERRYASMDILRVMPVSTRQLKATSRTLTAFSTRVYSNSSRTLSLTIPDWVSFCRQTMAVVE